MVDKAKEDGKDEDFIGGGGGGGGRRRIGLSSGDVSVSHRDEDQQAAAEHDTEVSKLPLRHWVCSVCKEVGASSERRMRAKDVCEMGPRRA